MSISPNQGSPDPSPVPAGQPEVGGSVVEVETVETTDPAPNQDLPADQPVVDNSLPDTSEEQPPFDQDDDEDKKDKPAKADKTKGKSDEAHAHAPGQQKKAKPK